MNSAATGAPQTREVRAYFNDSFIRVYQAYNDQIANAALEQGTFVSPPFSMTRMTWIKPSFLWMMYRAGWGFKDGNQKRILAIDLTHQGFQWALSNSCPSSFKPKLFRAKEEWEALKSVSPVRIQWDPERDIRLQKLDYRSIQIGLSGLAVQRFVDDWIVNISDITDLAHRIKVTVDSGDVETARSMLPHERNYNLPPDIADRLEIICSE